MVKSDVGVATIAAIGLPAINVGEVLGDKLTKEAFVVKTAVALADEVKLADKSVLLGLGILGIVGDDVFVDLA